VDLDTRTRDHCVRLVCNCTLNGAKRLRWQLESGRERKDQQESRK
jgi:hypothetical protein